MPSVRKVKRWWPKSLVLIALLGAWVLSPGGASAQGPITLDGVASNGEWDPTWQVATDPLDVFLTDTGVHPHESPTYARSGYDATALWAHYQAGDDRWYFRLDVDGRAGDSDSTVGTASSLGVGTHGADDGPLVVAPFVDGDGLGTSEAYKLGFQCADGAAGQTASLGPGTAILPGVIASTTDGVIGQGVYSTTIPGVIEFAFDRTTLFPDGSYCPQLWLSAQVGDNNDRVSDDQIVATLVTALDLSTSCPDAPLVAGEEATFPVAYAIPPDAEQGVTDVTLTVQVPDGTTFVSAGGGGVEAGGVITWDLGEVGPGDGDQLEFTLRLGTSISSVIIVSEISSAEGLRNRSVSECPVQQPTPTPTPTPIPEGSVPVVPEPATWLLTLTGLGGLAGYATMQWRARRR